MSGFVFILLIISVLPGFAQQSDYLYYQNLVYLQNGSVCSDQPPDAGFMVYLNHDKSKILTHEAPRWGKQNDDNIDGKGAFGVELGNFRDPGAEAGDSVTVIFTSEKYKQQGVLTERISTVPWYRFPVILTLEEKNLPSPPQDIRLTQTEAGDNKLQWHQKAGLTYTLYRRSLLDTLADGRQRMLYTRIADNLNGDNYVDRDIAAAEAYGYVLVAVNDQGMVSMPSPDIFRYYQAIELTASQTSQNITLKWSPVECSDITGYNIYRYKAGETPDSPVAYTGLDTVYTDTRLVPDSEYIYKVLGRISRETEYGKSEPLTVSTLSRDHDYYTYANLKTAVVIYKNTDGGKIYDHQIADIHYMMEKARLFYWINSGMKLNMEFSWFEIDAFKDYPDADGLYIQETALDLAEKGVMNTQYDVVFRITPAIQGYWSVGVPVLNLPGPKRRTGFSHSHWPIGTGVRYPEHHDSANMGLTWIFVHEAQHALDALYDANNYAEFYHGDKPWEFPVACGEHFDFQAGMFRHFKAYEELLSEWGDIYQAVDADHDLVPDDDPRVPLDEMRFNSRPDSKDSDADGLDDRAEAINGIYRGSDPQHPDTDHDGLVDGQDAHPRYPVNTEIPFFSPIVDGSIDAEWPSVNDTVSYSPVTYAPELYLAYDSDFFYIGLDLPYYSRPEIFLDVDADGWWWSSGNTVMSIDPVSNTFKSFRSWDAGTAVKTFALARNGPGGMWDTESTYQNQFDRRVIDPALVTLKSNYDAPEAQIEMAIPKTPYAGLNLNPNDRIALNIVYHSVNGNRRNWAATFDLYDFVEFHLQNTTTVDNEKTESHGIDQFVLSQNYPNPFNPETRIEFFLPKRQHINLDIYNAAGQHIKTLLNAETPAGNHVVKWNGTDDQGKSVANGIYFYRFINEQGMHQIRKMSFLK
jgi:hypothetical protein